MKFSIYTLTILGAIGLNSAVGEPARAEVPQPKRAQASESMKAQKADIGRYDPKLKRLKTMSCVVNGRPVEFPNDIKITNLGSSVIPAGTTIHWTVNPSIKGNDKLSAALNPNQTASLSNVLGGGLPAGTPCSAYVLVRSSG